VSFASDVMPLLKSKCSACHSTGGRGAADVEMFDASGTAKFDNIKGHIGDMITQTRTGRMPMGGPPLSTDQISILESWQAQGTPNN
jgi:mono/diheme cytochrome c family protein